MQPPADVVRHAGDRLMRPASQGGDGLRCGRPRAHLRIRGGRPGCGPTAACRVRAAFLPRRLPHARTVPVEETPDPGEESVTALDSLLGPEYLALWRGGEEDVEADRVRSVALHDPVEVRSVVPGLGHRPQAPHQLPPVVGTQVALGPAARGGDDLYVL